jgi:hypothetical protein
LPRNQVIGKKTDLGKGLSEDFKLDNNDAGNIIMEFEYFRHLINKLCFYCFNPEK